jgi:hypothetical protein
MILMLPLVVAVTLLLALGEVAVHEERRTRFQARALTAARSLRDRACRDGVTSAPSLSRVIDIESEGGWLSPGGRCL